MFSLIARLPSLAPVGSSARDSGERYAVERLQRAVLSLSVSLIARLPWLALAGSSARDSGER